MCPLRPLLRRTPLFPPPNQKVMFKQGRTGDCYLLAALDCVLNSNEKRRKAVESMFQKTPEGGVYLRIKRTSSLPLQKDKLKSKYQYYYDRKTEEDVIFISREQLEDIDREEKGVTTNCLAVKIFERISSYCFTADWDPNISLASFKAHAHTRFRGMPSGVFVSHLLGIEISDYSHYLVSPKKIDKLIKIVEKDPSAPIFIAINFGKRDSHGNRHGRHALKLEKIMPDPKYPGQYLFHLINPWNTEGKRVVLNYEEFLDRQPNFCVFRDPLHYKEPEKKSANIVKKMPELPDIFKEKINQFRQKNKFFTKDINETIIRIEKLKQNREQILKNFDAALERLEIEVCTLEQKSFSNGVSLDSDLAVEARDFYRNLMDARNKLIEDFPRSSLGDFRESCLAAVRSHQKLPLLNTWRKIFLTFINFIGELIHDDGLLDLVDQGRACLQQEDNINHLVKDLKEQLQEIESDETLHHDTTSDNATKNKPL